MTRFATIRLAHTVPGTRHLLSFINGSDGNCCRRCGDFHSPEDGERYDLTKSACHPQPIFESPGERRWWPQGEALAK